MNSPKDFSKTMQANKILSTGEKKIKLRTLSPAETKAELALRVTKIETAIAQLEKAQIVTHDTLQLEFKI